MWFDTEWAQGFEDYFAAFYKEIRRRSIGKLYLRAMGLREASTLTLARSFLWTLIPKTSREKKTQLRLPQSSSLLQPGFLGGSAASASGLLLMSLPSGETTPLTLTGSATLGRISLVVSFI